MQMIYCPNCKKCSPAKPPDKKGFRGYCPGCGVIEFWDDTPEIRQQFEKYKIDTEKYKEMKE